MDGEGSGEGGGKRLTVLKICHTFLKMMSAKIDTPGVRKIKVC